MSSQLVCAICGSEVKQEGAAFRCQNYECKAETPIDMAAANAAMSRDSLTQAMNEGIEAE